MQPEVCEVRELCVRNQLRLVADTKNKTMNTKQENKFSMYLLVKTLLNTFNAVWAGIPGFVLAAGEFFGKIGEIDNAVQVQETSVKGYTQNKKKAKGKMVGKALKIAGALKKYATDIDDSALFEDVNFTESELLYATDTLVRERCLKIHAKAMLHAAALVPEGILAIDITELSTLIAAYETIIGSPSQIKADRKVATANLKVFIKQTDIILKQKIDMLMLQFKDSNSDFYNKYVADRKVIDLGVQHTRASGVVKDTEGNELEDVVVSVVGTDLVKTTNADGVYLFKPFIPGDFSFSIAKQGFVTQLIENVHVSPGQHIVIDVVLEREVFTITIGSGQVVNVFGPGSPQWTAGVTLKIKNITQGPSIGGGHFYPANSAGEGWDGTGTPILPGQEVIHTVTAAEFKAFMNGFVPGPNEQVFEVTIL